MAKRRAPIQKKSPRLIKRGDVVRVTLPGGTEIDEVVRSADLLLHMANGNDVIVSLNEPLHYVVSDEVPEELRIEIEAMESE